MNRPLAVFAATAALAGATLALPVAASASAKAPIRTYTGRGSVALTGVGKDKGWYHDYSQSWAVTLSPQFAAATSYGASYVNDKDQHVTLHGSFDFAGHASYVKVNNGAWKRTALTSTEWHANAVAENPYTSQAQFDALPGVHRVGTGRYQVTGGYAKVGSFLDSEFQLPASAVSGNGIKSVTLTLREGPAGRPVTITATGTSSTVHLSAQETFGNYNKPLTIHAPR